MTISRAIVLAISALFCLIILSIFLVGIHNAKNSVNNQLTANAEDSAGLIAEAFRPQLEKLATLRDQPSSVNNTTAQADLLREMSVTARALNDSGNRYLKIQITFDGSKIVNFQRQKFVVPEVAPWFINLIKLNKPTEDSELPIYGPSNIYDATVTIQLSPEYVYETLWNHIKDQLFLLILLMIVTIGLTSLTVRVITMPLSRIRQQAENIRRFQYTLVDKLPRTSDLRQVVEATNAMSCKIKKTIEDMTEVATVLRKRSNQDPLTKLANFRSFKARLRDLIRSEEDFMKGVLIFGKIANLSDVYAQKGTTAGDEIVKYTTDQLNKVIRKVHSSFAAYISHAEHDIDHGVFAIVAPNLPLEEASMLAKQMQHMVKQQSTLDSHIAIVEFQDLENNIDNNDAADLSANELISLAKNTLNEADSEADMISIKTVEDSISEAELTAILENALKTQTINMELQKTQTSANDDHSILYYELLTSIKDNKNNINIDIAAFKRIAESTKLAVPLDKLTIEKFFGYIEKEEMTNKKYIINLSLDALLSEEFFDWLDNKLSECSKLAPHLNFELYEQYVIENINRTNELAKLLAKHQCGFGIDRVCREFSSVEYLRKFENIDYIKINGGSIFNIHKDIDNQLVVRTVIEIAKSLGILAIAEEVDSMADHDYLTGVGIDAIIGSVTERPISL